MRTSPTRRRAAALSLTAAVLLLAPARAAAQERPYKVTSLAEGVYAITREAPTPVSDANSLVIVNEHDVVVVDANILPSYTREVIAEIRRITPLPVRYVVNTHWHSDHHYGNAVYREEYPGVEIIQHAATREAVFQRDTGGLSENMRVTYPAQLAHYRDLKARGVNSQGAPLTAAQRVFVDQLITMYETFLRDMSRYAIVPGTMTITDSLVLQRGDRRIVVKWLGRGNTAGDLVVHLPRERILAMGDLVVLPSPYGYFSHLGDWPATLRAAQRLDARWILPGHGPPQSDWAYVDRLIPVIEAIYAQVRAAVQAGATLEQTKQRVQVDALRDALIGSGEELRPGFVANFLTPAIEAAFAELSPAAPSSAGS